LKRLIVDARMSSEAKKKLFSATCPQRAES